MIMVISPSKRWLDDLAKQRKADERAAAVTPPIDEQNAAALDEPAEVDEPPLDEPAEVAPASDES